MLRHVLFGLIAIVAVPGIASAGRHYYFPAPVIAAPPVVYGAPVVSYYPAYPVAAVPVTPVIVPAHYVTPVVVVPTPRVYVAQPALVGPVGYAAPMYYGYPMYRHRRFRGVEVEIERDGDIEIDYR